MMGRVLRIGAGVLGVLLVVMTAAFAISRRAGMIPQYMAVETGEYGDDGESYLIDRETLRHIPSKSCPMYPPPDDDAWTATYRSPQSGIFPESTFKDIEVINSKTGSSRIVTDQLTYPATVDERFSLLASPDGKWLAFHVYQWDEPDPDTGLANGHHDVYVVQPTGNNLKNLTATFDTHAEALAWSLDGRWLLIRIDGTLYRSQPDTSELVPLFPKDDINAEQWPIGILPDKQTALVFTTSQPNTLLAVNLEDLSIRWKHSVGVVEHTPDWSLIGITDGQSLELLTPSGQTTNVVTLPEGMMIEEFWSITPDNNWLLFSAFFSPGGQRQIWRVGIYNNDAEFLWGSQDLLIGFGGWTREKTRYVFVSNSSSRISTLYDIRPDGSGPRVIMKNPNGYTSFLGWQDCTHTWSPIASLIGGTGLVGISIFGKRPHHLIRQRRRPAA